MARTVLLALAVAGLLWFAGEQHRSHCAGEGLRGCTVLPWSGHEPPSIEVPQSRTEQLLERRARLLEGQ